MNPLRLLTYGVSWLVRKSWPLWLERRDSHIRMDTVRLRQFLRID
jgi:hypothetical protein